MIRGVAISLKRFLDLLEKHGIEHPEEKVIREQLSPCQDATTSSKSFFLRQNVDHRGIDMSVAASGSINCLPNMCLCFARVHSARDLDTLMDEVSKRVVAITHSSYG